MNFRNKYLLITIRTLFGLMMTFSGVMGFLAGSSMEGVPPEMIPTMQTLLKTGIFQMIKTTEIVAGLMLVIGFLPALAAIFIAPIAVGIVVVNSMIAPDMIISGVIVCLFNAYLGYAYWDKYKALFKR